MAKLNLRDEIKKRKLNPEKYQNQSNTLDLRKEVATRKFNSSLGSFQSEASSIANMISNAYKGWQTPETMRNTYNSAQKMYNEIGKYKHLNNEGLNAFASDLKKTLDGWGELEEVYSHYKTADAFNSARRNAQLGEQFKGLSYEGVQAEKKKYSPDSEEYNFLNKYTNYSNLKDFDKALADKKTVTPDKYDFLGNHNSSVRNFDKFSPKKPEEKVNPSDIGFESANEYNNYIQDLETGRNKRKLDYAFDLYEDYLGKNDFESGSKYTQRLTDDDIYALQDTADVVYEYLNNPSKRKAITDSITIATNGTSVFDADLYERLSPEEIKTFNYIYNNEGNEAANKFLKDMEITLSKREYDEKSGGWKSASDGIGGGILHSALSLPASLVGGISSIGENLNSLITGSEYNPYSSANWRSNYASDVRENVGENIANATKGFEIFGQNISSFLYQTGMSLADSYAGARLLGPLYMATMSSNAFQQKAKDMTEAGENESTVFATALSSALAEYIFEKISFDRFMSIKGIDSKRAILKSALAQAGVEGSEEFFTEFSNIVSDTILRGNSSEFAQYEKDLKDLGYSEKDINKKLWEKGIGQVIWATIGGGLSGGAMGGFASIGDYNKNSSIGKPIKANERVKDLIDLVGDEGIGDAYETYSQYAKKGINAENIKDAQAGRLYREAHSGAVETLNNEKSTTEQREKAFDTLGKLGMLSQENTLKKQAQENAEKYKVNEASKVDVKSVEFKEGKISDENITLNIKDAELVGYAEQIAKEKGDEMANLFLSQYDGKTDVDKYAQDFNLASEYADKDFSFDHIVKNKGSLSATMVSNIYKETIVKAAQEKKANLQKLVNEMADKGFYKGFVDDSAIDYDNKSTEGKINWNALTSKQREAVTFMKGFAKATGMRIQLVANNPDFNGKYDRDTNVVMVNLDNMESAVKGIKDSVIPALSHETTHWMKEKSPELWTRLNEIVFQTLVDHYNSNTDLKRKRELLRKLGEYYNDENLKARKITEAELIQREIDRLKTNKNYKGKTDEELESIAREEIIARACEDMLSMSKQGKKMFATMTAEEQKTFVGKIKAIIRDLMAWLDKTLKLYQANSTEALIMQQYKDQLQKASQVWDEMLKRSVEVNQALEKSGAYKDNNTTKGDVLHSGKITIGMSDSKRADILRNKTIKDIPVAKEISTDILEKLDNVSSWKDINNFKGKDKRHLIRKIAQEFGVFKEYNNSDINISFEFSGNNFGESYGKQKRNYENFAKMFSVFDEVIEKAVGIEVHNRNNEGYKTDVTLNNVYVLISAFEDGEWIVPVKLEVKEFKDKQNTLYVAISLEAIKKTEVSKQGTTENSVAQNSRSVTISIPHIFIKINPKDINFLKYIPNEFLSKEQIDAKNNATKVSQFLYSAKDDDFDIDTEINQSMTMAEAKTMLEKAFVIGEIKEFYDGEYKTADEWLRGVGASEVAIYIENEYTLMEKYLNKLQGYLDGDFYVEDILDAYLEGTLVGREKPKSKRLELGKNYRINDERFYSPKQIKDARNLLSVAMQRVTNENRKEVTNARAKILLFAHNKGASDLLGLSQTELNKKLRTWSGYSAKALDISKRFNNGVADSNKWTGIENCSWLVQSQVTEKELESLVKEIKGSSSQYERNYIARTMLALDTHIDWTELIFDFKRGYADETRKSVRGLYDNSKRTITIGGNSGMNTVAHEMGHALDYKWHRDLFGKRTDVEHCLSENPYRLDLIEDADAQQFVKNFSIFIDSLTDVSVNYSAYTMESKETFARFVAKFVEWVEQVAGGRGFHETDYYGDKFTASQYIEFVKLLQEKAMLDSRKMETETKENEDIRYSAKDSSVYENDNGRDSEIEKLKADIENLKERLALEKKITGGNEFNRNQLGAVARHLRKIANSNMDNLELMKALKGLYTHIATSPELAWDDVWDKSYKIAKKMMDESTPITIADDYAKKILKHLQGSAFSLDATQKAEAQYIFDKHWNRSFMGKVKVRNDAPNIDTMWQEWAGLFPDVFDADIGNNKIRELYDIIETLKDASETIDEYSMEEKTKWLAHEIYNQYWNVSPIKTTADKYNEKIKALESKHRVMMRETREAYEEKVEAQKLVDDMYYKRRLREANEKAKSDVEKQKIADDIYYGKKLLKKEKIIELREIGLARQRETIENLRERRDRDVAEAKEKGKANLDKYKERAERKTVMQSIMATVTSLNKKFEKNDKDVHIPEALKPVVANLINAIDYSSKQLLGMDGTRKDMRGTPTKNDIALDKKFEKAKSMTNEGVSLKQAMSDTLKMFQDAEKVLNSVADGTMDMSLPSLDLDLIDGIEKTIKSLDILEKNYGDSYTLQQMELEHLKTLNATVKSVNHWANQIDYALESQHKQRISELGNGTTEDVDVLGKNKEYIEAVEGLKKFFLWSNLTPINAFERLGKNAMKLFKGLQNAQSKLAQNKQDILDFTADLFKGKLKDIKKWRTEVKEFKLTLPDGTNKTIKMPVSYVMTLYCLQKQEDAQRHLTGKDKEGNQITYEDQGKTKQGGGMTIAPFKSGKLTVTREVRSTVLTNSLINQITDSLSQPQKDMADALQEWMDTKGSEWGNSVSEKLYGVKKFVIENYFPITVSPTEIKTTEPRTKKSNRVHFYSILNFGFTKNRNPKPKQSIEVGDIFEIFANHMSQVAIYNAYALPIFDIVRWYNYKGVNGKGKDINVQESIAYAFGDDALNYIDNLLSDLNGQNSSSRLGFVTEIFRNTKLAMVGNSLSVALIQPTAYLKAMVHIPNRYLLKALLHVRDFGARNGIRKAKKWCGIALWKSQGNFDTDISNSTQAQMLHDENWIEKAKGWSLKFAEKMDELTWGVLWNACEFDVRANQKDLEVNSPEFFKAVAEKLEYTIYKTQVVDSPLTRSDIMRSPDNLAKMLTMFGSEMTVAYNMVSEVFVQTSLDVRKYGKKEGWKRNLKPIALTLISYTLTSAASQILNTMVQLMRDDEDKEPEEIMKMYFTNFLSDWLIFGKIPYVKEYLNSWQGYSSSRPDTLWMDSSVKSIKYFIKAFDGKEGYGEKAIKEALKSLSYLSGLPMYNLYRDAIATLDTFKILDAEDFKEMIDDIFN